MTETKGQATKNHILKEGLMLASVKGLVNISIGGLAAKAEMSRSGLFAHFLSKEQLQLEILDFANQLFAQVVLQPCSKIESPSEQIQFLVRVMPGWYEKTDPKIPGGCIFLTATLEFDDRPGKVKDMLLQQQTQFLNFLKDIHNRGVETGEFKGGMGDSDFAFVFYSMYMGYNQYQKFFGDEDARQLAEHHMMGLLDWLRKTPPGTIEYPENTNPGIN